MTSSLSFALSFYFKLKLGFRGQRENEILKVKAEIGIRIFIFALNMIDCFISYGK